MAKYKEPVKLLSQSVSGAAVQSKALDVRGLHLASFHVNCGAGLNATFQILGSNDGVNFPDLQEVVSPITGSAANFMVNLDGVAVAYLKFQVTPSSGTGQVDVWGAAKGI